MAKELPRVQVEVLKSCGASGRALEAGKKATISAEDAKILSSMGKVKVMENKAVKTAEAETDTTPELTDEQKFEKLCKAIEGLNPEDEAHFTQSGKPDANVLGEKCGFDVSAKLRDAAWAEFDTTEPDSANGASVTKGLDGGAKTAAKS